MEMGNRRGIAGAVDIAVVPPPSVSHKRTGVAGTAANIAAAVDSDGGKSKAPDMNVTQEQLNGIAKNPDDTLGLKAQATSLPNEGELNSLGAKLQKIKA